MSRIRVVPIVEGHGEVASIRTLLERIWREEVGGDYIDVLKPIRKPKSKLVQPSELLKVLELADLSLSETTSQDRRFVLVLMDADEDCPVELVSRLLPQIRVKQSHLDVAIVIANVEFETWFVAAAESLAGYFDLARISLTTDPETTRQRKAAVLRMLGGTYTETIDQPRLTAAFDLRLCRSRSRSFDKLCRELERRKSP